MYLHRVTCRQVWGMDIDGRSILYSKMLFTMKTVQLRAHHLPTTDLRSLWQVRDGYQNGRMWCKHYLGCGWYAYAAGNWKLLQIGWRWHSFDYLYIELIHAIQSNTKTPYSIIISSFSQPFSCLLKLPCPYSSCTLYKLPLHRVPLMACT